MRLSACCIQLAFLGAFSGSVLAASFPYSEWNLANYNGAFATFSDGLVSINNGGSDYWDVQLTRKNIELQSGKTYEVKFFLQGVSARHYTEIRIGRDGFPYDAFAEFGEVVATVNGREVSKTFKMNSGNVSNARLEFNFGKSSGSVYFSDVSLNCLDCGITSDVEFPKPSDSNTSVPNVFVVVADEVDFRDYSMALGDVFGSKLELGADSKIYGDVSVSNECFLRERAFVQGILRQSIECTEQNGISTSSRINETLQKPTITVPKMSVGVVPMSVDLDESLQLSSGSYGAFYANTRAKVHLTSGSYTFQNFYTEPDVEFTFDMSSGPISINVAGDVRFGDRNHFTISGGNPSEITWNIAGEAVDLGTDGLYYGRFVAPGAYVRIPSRSNLVGGVYAGKFVMEPQSTVSQEPRVEEISHSEEHFGPFFEPGTFRYRSQLPLNVSSVEMYVYANNSTVKINGGKSTIVELPASSGNVEITVSREMISGFPVEAFRSTYVFDFTKSSNYRIFWNPQSQCKQGCDGSTAATAIGDFETVLATAQSTGREINMAGGIWDVTDNYKDGVVPWKIGFELVGYTKSIWDLNSSNNLPTIYLGETSHIEVIGKSPRSFVGFWIANGFNKRSGGAIASESLLLNIKSALLSANISDADGGTIYSKGSLTLNNVHIKNSKAKNNGGAIYVEKELNMQNVIMDKNSAFSNGGAVYSMGNAFARNLIITQNTSGHDGGAWYATEGNLMVSNATVFKNNAHTGMAAFGGNALGSVYNSIFWRNNQETCSVDGCGKSLSGSLLVHHSITEKEYSGEGNFVADPKFVNESNPAGTNEYMSMNAGLTLADGSPAIGAGVKDAFVMDTDILNFVRSERVDLGAYIWYDLNADVEMGEYTYDQFIKRNPAMPIFDRLGDEYDIRACGNSPSGRVMRKKIPRSDGKNVSKAVIKFTLVNQYGVLYSIPSIEVDFYKVGEENGYYIFQTLAKAPSANDYDPNKHGRLLIFTSDVAKIGKYGSVMVMPIMNLGDKFIGETVRWE